MRPGIIVAIFAAVIVLIGGVIWYNNSQAENARVEQQRSEQAAQIAREEDATREADIARQQEETAAADQAAQDAEAAEGTAGVDNAVAADEVQSADDDVIVVGDEITEDTIVIESATDGPTILDPDDTASSTAIISDDSAENLATGTTSEAAAPTDPDQLLTRENFDRDEVLDLIDTAEQISTEERSTLRALVEGASANPAMLEATIRTIRDALDLPVLN